MNILNPPKSYIEYRATLYGLDDPKDIQDAKTRFYNTFKDSKAEISQFFNELQTSRDNNSLPVERIEDRYTKKVIPMMIYDIEYFRMVKQLKQRKVYIPLEDTAKGNELPEWLIKIKANYKRKEDKRKEKQVHQIGD